MNIIDRVVEIFDPIAARRRQAARSQLDIVRAYDAASQGRRVQNWNAPASNADTEIILGGPRLRNRARDTVRNNPHGAKIVSIMANNLVGDGIMPRAVLPGDGDQTEREEEINRIFAIWAAKSGFYSKQYTAARELVESGEILAQKKITKKQTPLPGQKPEDLPVSLDFDLLEADFLDDAKQSTGGTTIVGGVEHDRNGVRTGYWLFESHPGGTATSGGSTTSKRVKAEEIAHLYEHQRTQSRGVSWLAPVLVPLRELMEYEAAEIVRKKIEACVVGIVSNPDADDVNPGVNTQAGVVNAQGQPIERMEPGMFAYSRGGKNITFNSPSVTAGYEAYKRAKLKEIASGSRVPYMLMAEDMSDANFAASRMGLLEFRRFITSIQWHFIIPEFCQKIWDWFIAQAKLEGLIDMNLVVNVEWSPPRFEQITPLDDVRADIMAVRAGFRSQQDVMSGYGRPPRVVLKEIDAFNQSVDASVSKIVLDTDPRKTTQQGMLQMDDEGEGDTADAATEEKPAPKRAPRKSNASGK